jgi:uncharacterized protein (TIGR02145 family)
MTVVLGAIGTVTINGSMAGDFGADNGMFQDDRDGQWYDWVKIGDQIWMAENLNYAQAGSYCYGGLTSNCDTYGRLYKWHTAMSINSTYASTHWSGSDVNRQGVCAEGWHLPNRAEWEELATYIANRTPQAIKLSNGWDSLSVELADASWSIDGEISNNTYGFSAIPAGVRSSSNTYVYLNTRTVWWTSTEYSSYQGYKRGIADFHQILSDGDYHKLNSISVRCVLN